MSLLVAASNPLQGASGPPRRVANRRAAAACLAWLAGSVLAVTGCDGQASVALPHKAAPPAGVPVAATDPPLTVRQQVIAAYMGYWQALGQALDTQNPGRARAI